MNISSHFLYYRLRLIWLCSLRGKCLCCWIWCVNWFTLAYRLTFCFDKSESLRRRRSLICWCYYLFHFRREGLFRCCKLQSTDKRGPRIASPANLLRDARRTPGAMEDACFPIEFQGQCGNMLYKCRPCLTRFVHCRPILQIDAIFSASNVHEYTNPKHLYNVITSLRPVVVNSFQRKQDVPKLTQRPRGPMVFHAEKSWFCYLLSQL